MAAYDVTHEDKSGIVICRIHDILSDEDARALGTDLRDAMASARSRAPGVRMLLENRKGVTFDTPALQALTSQIQSAFGPEDRTAVIIPSILMKARARDHMLERQETFLSESAALTWLNAWE